MANILARQRQLIGTSAEYVAADIVGGDGELLLERAAGGAIKMKVGDGVQKFSALSYFGGGGGGADRDTPVALTPAATIAVDLAAHDNFTLSMTMTGALGNPTNVKVGRSGAIVIDNATAAFDLTFSGNWKFAGGKVPTLTKTVNAIDVLVYYVESAARITARLIKDVK